MIEIRPPKKEDQKDIVDLFHQLVPEPAKFNYFADFELDLLIEEPNCHCLVIEHQGSIIGFGSLVVFRTPVFGQKGRIEDIIIHEDHRGQGLGKKLMQKLISIAKEKNIKHIHLTSNPRREAARNLYLSLGFRQYDTGVFVLEMEE